MTIRFSIDDFLYRLKRNQPA